MRKLIFFTEFEFWSDPKFEPFFFKILEKLGLEKIEINTLKMPQSWKIINGEVRYDFTNSIWILRKSFRETIRENPKAFFLVDQIGPELILQEKKRLLSRQKNSFLLSFDADPKSQEIRDSKISLNRIKPFGSEFVFESKDFSDLFFDYLLPLIRRQALQIWKALEADPICKKRLEKEQLEFLQSCRATVTYNRQLEFDFPASKVS